MLVKLLDREVGRITSILSVLPFEFFQNLLENISLKKTLRYLGY